MRIVIFGVGGVGGYVGGRLAQAGEEVTLIARGAHGAALRDHGLRVRTPQGNFAVRLPVTDDPATLTDPADLILITVKSYDTAAAVASIAPIVGPQTAILTLQNGVTNHEAFAAAYGRERVLVGAIRIEASIEEPGLIVRASPGARTDLGPLDPAGQAAAEAVLAAFVHAGLDAHPAADPLRALWEKFILLASLSAVTTAVRRTVGEVREGAETRELLHAVMAEVAAVGRAGGVALADDVVAGTAAFVDRLPAAMRTSMQKDAARGGRLEVEALQGELVRLGRATGIPTPCTLALYAVLAAEDERNRTPSA